MTALPNCLLVVTAEVDAAVEAELEPMVRRGPCARCARLSRRAGGRRYITSGRSPKVTAAREGDRRPKLYTTVYELDSPAAVETKEFAAMRGWDRFAPHVRSQTRVVVSMAG